MATRLSIESVRYSAYRALSLIAVVLFALSPLVVGAALWLSEHRFHSSKPALIFVVPYGLLMLVLHNAHQTFFSNSASSTTWLRMASLRLFAINSASRSISLRLIAKSPTFGCTSNLKNVIPSFISIFVPLVLNPRWPNALNHSPSTCVTGHSKTAKLL